MKYFRNSKRPAGQQASSGTRRERRVVGRGVVATSVSVALVATGMVGLVANASPSQSDAAVSAPMNSTFTTMVGEAPGLAPVGSDELDAAVGTTVAVTTDQKGNESAFNLFLINTQISGEGSGTILIPVGETDEKVVDFESQAGEVELTTSLQGPFDGERQMTVTTELMVNGESVDPDEGYNLTGDVEITYVFTNTSGEMQDLTFQNAYGQTTTVQKEVPVPWGGTFNAPFGEGWFIAEADGMSQTDTPGGTTLGATVMNFPIMPGVGSTEERFTIKARAENASLPSTLTSGIPVDLSVFANGVALDLIPGIESKVLGPLDAMIGGVASEIISIGALLGGFAGALDSLNQNSLNPLLQEIQALNVDPDALEANLTAIGSEFSALGALLVADSAGQEDLALLFDALSVALGVTLADLLGNLDQLLNKQLPPDLRQAADGLRELNSVLGALNQSRLRQDIRTLKPTCEVVGNTSTAYGYASPIPGVDASPGYGALDQAIDDATQPTKGNLKALQTQLDKQSEGTLMPSLLYMIPGGPEVFTDPACQTVLKLTEDVVLPIAENWNAVEMALLAAKLDILAEALGSPAVGGVLEGLEEALVGASKLMSNPDDCNAEALKNAVESGDGIAGIFESCGIAQLVRLVAALDLAVGEGVEKLGTLMTDLGEDSETIANTIDGISDASASLEESLNSLPGALGEVTAGIVSAGTDIETKGTSKLGEVSTGANELQAMLEAMTLRVKEGDGAPYGGATGPEGTRNLVAYQITVSRADAGTTMWWTSLGLAALFLILALGLGTFLARRGKAN
jgi:hypothetical protein